MGTLKELVDFDIQSEIKITKKKLVESENEFTVYDLEYSNGLGGNVEAFLVQPKDAENKLLPGIHFIHWLETASTTSNRTQFLPYAKKLAKIGFVSILPTCFWSVDPVKYKEDPMSYHSKWWKTQFEDDVKLCKNQITELLITHKVLLQLNTVDPQRIGIGAHDFGAMFGSLLASFGFQLKAVAFMAATGKFSDWFRFGSNLTENELELYISDMSFLDPISNIGVLASVSKLFQFADDDFYVPKVKAKEYFDEASGDKELRWYQAKHEMNMQAFEDMIDWLLEKI